MSEFLSKRDVIETAYAVNRSGMTLSFDHGYLELPEGSYQYVAQAARERCCFSLKIGDYVCDCSEKGFLPKTKEEREDQKVSHTFGEK